MFEGLNVSVIENIKKRLRSELEDKELPGHRKEEVLSLISYAEDWIKEKRFKKRGVLENEKEIFLCYFLFNISYLFGRLQWNNRSSYGRYFIRK